MDVTKRRAQRAGKRNQFEEQRTRNDHWRGQKENSTTQIKAGAAPCHGGLRNNNFRAIAAAPGGLRAIRAWIAAWTKGEARTPRNESVESSTDSTTRQRRNKSETDRPHRSIGEGRARNIDGKKTSKATKERRTQQNKKRMESRHFAFSGKCPVQVNQVSITDWSSDTGASRKENRLSEGTALEHDGEAWSLADRTWVTT